MAPITKIRLAERGLWPCERKEQNALSLSLTRFRCSSAVQPPAVATLVAVSIGRCAAVASLCGRCGRVRKSCAQLQLPLGCAMHSHSHRSDAAASVCLISAVAHRAHRQTHCARSPLHCTRHCTSAGLTHTAHTHSGRISPHPPSAMSQPHPAGDAHKAHRTRQAGTKFDKKKEKDHNKRGLTQTHKNPRVSDEKGGGATRRDGQCSAVAMCRPPIDMRHARLLTPLFLGSAHSALLRQGIRRPLRPLRCQGRSPHG